MTYLNHRITIHRPHRKAGRTFARIFGPALVAEAVPDHNTRFGALLFAARLVKECIESEKEK